MHAICNISALFSFIEKLLHLSSLNAKIKWSEIAEYHQNRFVGNTESSPRIN